MKLRRYTKVPTKAQALDDANDLRKARVQYVRVKKLSNGWATYIGGRNSGKFKSY